MFEYTIPRLGKRIDVVLIIDGIVFILEYKAFKDEFQSADAIQVFDYALDLKNFHKESEYRFIVPILIMTDAEARENTLVEFRPQMYAPYSATPKPCSVKEIFRKGTEEDDFNRTCECVNRISQNQKKEARNPTSTASTGSTLRSRWRS